MPEYLAPGVYVEEVELAPRAITAVSTSTTGLIGISRRGPINKPTLVTNAGEYDRFFGSYLSDADYGDYRWLPYAVEGFFANGGSRAYITRVAPVQDPDDEEIDRENFAHVASAVLANQQLARRSLGAPAAAGATSINLAYAGGLQEGSTLVIGDGGSAETVRVTGFTDYVVVEPALAFDHDLGEGVTEMQVAQAADATLAAQAPNTEGAEAIRVAAHDALETDRWVRLTHANDVEIVQLGTVPGGSGVGEVPLAQPLAASFPPGTTVELADEPGDAATTLDGAAGADADTIQINEPGALAAGDLVIIAGDAGQTEVVTLMDTPADGQLTVQIQPNLRFAHADNSDVTRLSFAAHPASTTLVAGLRFADTLQDAQAGDQIIVGSGAQLEFVRLASAPDNDNTVSIAQPLRFPHEQGTEVRKVQLPDSTTTLSADVRAAESAVTVADASHLAAGDVIEIFDGAQTEYADVLSINNKTVTIDRELRYRHADGTSIRRLSGAIRVIAGPAEPDPAFYPEPGEWGNDIRIRVQPMSLITAPATASAVVGDTFVELRATTGIEPGTVLRFPGNEYATVSRVEGKRVFLDGGAPAALDSTAAGDDAWRGEVSSQEFRLTISYDASDEVFDGLSMDPRHSRFVEDVINRGSRTVHVEVLTEVADLPDNLPVAGDRWPGGGSDGLAGVSPATFVGADNSDADRRTGMFAMLNESGLSIVAAPGLTDEIIQLALISHCERAKYRFAVLDSHEGASLDDVQRQRSLYDSQYAALYYPWLKVYDPLANALTYAPPSGYIAGLYARTDQEVGVHKAPANAVLSNVLDLQFTVGKGQQDVLNPKGINAIRAFPNRGIRVWGARTISSDQPWRYVNVRRLFIMLEQSIDESTQYAVFEPNDLPLWNRLKAAVTAFLTVVWRQGALQGTTEDEAFFVRCGLGETMIQADIDAGQVIMVIGVAPVKPAEFVIFRIGQKAGPPPS